MLSAILLGVCLSHDVVLVVRGVLFFLIIWNNFSEHENLLIVIKVACAILCVGIGGCCFYGVGRN
jgi:hypothetical protein